MLEISQAKKIAILGYAPNVRFAPWNDPTFEMWGLNDQPWTMPRIDVLFELHRPDVIKTEGHWDRLKKLTIPVFMQEHYDEIPASVKYPMDAVRAKYTVDGCDNPFLTCSAAFMLPLAVDQSNVTEIHVFGVDMAQDTEFSHQRPSCEFWLGVCHGRGIKLTIQSSSDLLKTAFIYGYDDEKQTVFKSQVVERHKFLTDMCNAAAQKEQTAKEERLQYIGAIADCEHVMKRWT
jgi:hypothetical protein